MQDHIYTMAAMAVAAAVVFVVVQEMQKGHRVALAASAAAVTQGHSGAGAVEALQHDGINKPAHALAYYNAQQMTPKHDPLVNTRHYLPYGHLVKPFDDAWKTGTREPLIEQVGAVRGVAVEQARDTQTGMKSWRANAAVDDRLEPGPTRALIADRIWVHERQPTGVMTTRKQGRIENDGGRGVVGSFKLDSETGAGGLHVQRIKRGITTYDWNEHGRAGKDGVAAHDGGPVYADPFMS